MANSRDYTKPNSTNTTIKNEYSDLDILFTAHPISGDVTTKKDSDALEQRKKEKEEIDARSPCASFAEKF